MCFHLFSAIATFNLKALARQQQAEGMDEDEVPDGRRTRGRDEWGEDDGAEVSLLTFSSIRFWYYKGHLEGSSYSDTVNSTIICT